MILTVDIHVNCQECNIRMLQIESQVNSSEYKCPKCDKKVLLEQ